MEIDASGGTTPPFSGPDSAGVSVGEVTTALDLILASQAFANVERPSRFLRHVVEATLRYADFVEADEIFSSGNFAKLSAITRIDDRPLQPGPVFRKAGELYRAFAATQRL